MLLTPHHWNDSLQPKGGGKDGFTSPQNTTFRKAPTAGSRKEVG